MLSLQAKYKRKHIMLQAVYNLETKNRRKDGTYPLKVKIYRSRTEYCFIGLKIYLLTEQWDGKKIVNTPEASILNARLNFYRLNIGKVLLEYDMSGETVSKNKHTPDRNKFTGYLLIEFTLMAIVNSLKY